ncbi:MAG TPA: hypothetical protein VHO50_08880 [Bacteroidales bacterium]|nr:hypothetical protein [Bacteroidales bacterium]
MRNIFFLSLLILMLGCRQNMPESDFTAAKASAYFSKVEEICKLDNGSMWGKNLYGPIMYVETETRRIYANQQDSMGLLKHKDGIYTGLYPNELVIMNSPVVYGGTKYAMVNMRPDLDEKRVLGWTIHVLYHSFQNLKTDESTFSSLRRMDEYDARLWIKLEWKALRKAVNNNDDERCTIRDALVFRYTYRELYNAAFTNELNLLETSEGLASFTDHFFTSASPEEMNSRINDLMDWIYNIPSYSAVYGNITGAMYANLLHKAGYDFKNLPEGPVDLGKIVCEVYNINLPEICRDVAGSLALCYDLPQITNEEQERAIMIKERLHKLTEKYTEKPVVYLELEDPSFDFKPEEIQPLDTLGILYGSIRVSDNWGKLTVDKGGCLVSGNFGFLRVTAKGFRYSKNRISGEGWSLFLNQGWELVEVNDSYFLRQQTAPITLGESLDPNPASVFQFSLPLFQ